jgi:hypothetical protein
MIYIKSFLAGLAALIIVAALIVGVALVAPFIMERVTPPTAGGVDFDVISLQVSIWMLLAGTALLAAAVSYWTYRRLRARGHRS